MLLAESVGDRLAHHVFHRDLAGQKLPLALAIVKLALDEALQPRQIDVDVVGNVVGGNVLRLDRRQRLFERNGPTPRSFRTSPTTRHL